jgi:hypothetical protein
LAGATRNWNATAKSSATTQRDIAICMGHPPSGLRMIAASGAGICENRPQML